MNEELRRDIEAFVEQNTEAVFRDIARLVAIDSVEGAPEAEAQDVYAVLISLFPTLPLDNACVYVAAAYARALRRLDVQDSADKTKLRNDLYILATGVQNGCTDFYTTDKILLKQAARLAIPMRVHSLATVA